MRRHKSDRIIGILTFVLMGIGLIIIYAIGPMRANSVNAAYGSDLDENYFFIHQLISVALSVLAFVAAFKIPYEKVRKIAKPLMLIGLLLCLLLAIFALLKLPIAKCELGACRWFGFGSISFQPAEVLKIGLVLYLSSFIAEKKQEGKVGNFKDFWLPIAIVCGLSLIFVVIVQKDLGSGISLLAIILALLFMSGISIKSFALVCGIVAVAGVLSIVTSPHRLERIMTFSSENSEESSDNYHIENAMIAIGTGGVFGVGIGNSVQATGYLPESINDSIFAVMGETFGFVGLVVIVAMFSILLLRLLKTANALPNEESLVVTGIFAWVAAHVFINIAAMTGLVPLTGITLPLLSFGGTSMVFIAAALGLSLQLSCYTGRSVKVAPLSSRGHTATFSRDPVSPTTSRNKKRRLIR